ncbi:unnamed protein product [Penicillium salamii]|nr:unnamed protein product [Penicillium salamii]CAG8369113.1 unnamed protein product [Penicillium salamii]
MSTNMDLLGLDGLEGLYKDTLPVVSISASQSLNASAAGRDSIATGLPHLDDALAIDQQPGGILRGHVTEIFGPPGAGKTSLALNITRNALCDGKVVWIDTGFPLASPRLQAMSVNVKDFIHFKADTLAHLVALLMRPPTGFPPPETNLIVVDSVSNLFPSHFPSATELKEELADGKLVDKAHLQWLLGRRQNVSNDLGTHLARLAARNIAVVAINQSQTKIKEKREATLLPVLAGGAWEKNVQTRLAVYRALPDDRLVEIEKISGKPLSEPHELAVAFYINSNGLREKESHDTAPTILPAKSPGFEYYDPPTPTPSPLSSILSSPPPSPELKSPKFDTPDPESPFKDPPIQKPPGDGSPDLPKPNHASPPQAVHTPSKKRKMEEVADSQDEDSEEEAPWTDEATLNTNLP